MKKYIIILMLAVQGMFAQVTFEIVARQTADINDRLRIDFTMNADGHNFTAPSFEGFDVVAGPSQHVAQNFTQGVQTYKKTYTYFLIPTAVGTFSIGPASMEVDSTTYHTKPYLIKIIGSPEDPKKIADSLAAKTKEKMHLVGEVSNEHPKLNEAFIISYKLYFGFDIGITDLREDTNPKFTGFQKGEIKIKDLDIQQGEYKGEKCRVVTIRKIQLVPQQTGSIEIEPLSIDVDVNIPMYKKEKPLSNETIRLATSVIKIDVQQ